jgi:hypothetical protein
MREHALSLIQIKTNHQKTILAANIFLNEKQAFLQQYKIDDEELILFNKNISRFTAGSK